LWIFDCTIRECCKPGKNNNIQAIVYNGKNKYHALKYLAVSLANGMIIHCYGPIEGSLHDVTLQRLSEINIEMINLQIGNDLQLKLYGDKAFLTMSNIDVCHKAQRNHPLNEDQILENNAMKICRVTEEWIFGTAIQEFKLLTCIYNNITFLNQLSKYYIIYLLLINSLTCLKGNIVFYILNLNHLLLSMNIFNNLKMYIAECIQHKLKNHSRTLILLKILRYFC
jgi:hypothetical protein